MNSFIKKEFLNNNSLFAKKRKIIQTRFLDKTLFFGGMKSWPLGILESRDFTPFLTYPNLPNLTYPNLI